MNEIKIKFSDHTLKSFIKFFRRNSFYIVVFFLLPISVAMFILFLNNGLGLAYNDARSHLNIGRRVVEGLKPGLAQIGSVWLPLTHLLMVPTIWNDFMWHTGLSGALQSMVSFIATAGLIYLFLQKLKVGLFGRILGVVVFATNLNILYLQSTAMTELLLIATMTAGVYYLLLWHSEDNIVDLIKSSAFIMLSTLIRYDGWFLFLFSSILVGIHAFRRKGIRASEGLVIMFWTLGGVGIILWLLWNMLIFKDPLYFAFGPFSAHAQQAQLEAAGELPTKGEWFLSIKFYLYAMLYNSGVLISFLAFLGGIAIAIDKKISSHLKLASSALVAPFLFNVIALYLGHSVLFIQGLTGNSWFNIRYGVMMMPSLAIFIGVLVDRLKSMRWLIAGLIIFMTLISLGNLDAVTIDDATVGSSQKNVTEVSGWLDKNTKDKKGFIMISAASHDAIIFSSGLPMSRFIHEGTGAYWESASESPDRWARWIVMRTHDLNDLTYKEVMDAPGFVKYQLVDSYPFADIYELKEEFLVDLNTEPVFKNQK